MPRAIPAPLAATTAEILRDALAAMRDLAKGWTIHELHKAPCDIDLDRQDVLARLDAATANR